MKEPETTTFSKDSHEDSEYLIFERHFEAKNINVDEIEEDRAIQIPHKTIENDEELNTEDLGIIDIDDDDVFDNIGKTFSFKFHAINF